MRLRSIANLRCMARNNSSVIVDMLGLTEIKCIESLPNFGEHQEPIILGENQSSCRGHTGQCYSRHFAHRKLPGSL